MRLGIAVLAATVGMLLAAPLAQGFIYWSSYESGNSKIGRANIDGGDYRPSIVSGIYFGSGVASDGGHVYWSNNGNSGESRSAAVGRAAPDGAGPVHSFQPIGWYSEMFDVKATDGQIFWLKGSSVAGQEIGRTAAAGGQPLLLVGTGSNIYGFDVQGGYAYWSEGSYIVRGELSNPTAPDRKWLYVGPNLKPGAVSVEGDYIYWTEIDPSTGPPYNGFYGTSIGRAPLANPAAVINGFIVGARIRVFSGLDVEGEYVYWANAGDPALLYPQNIQGSIGRASIAGSAGNPGFIPLGTTSEVRMIDADDVAPVTPPPFVPQPSPPLLDRAYAVSTKNRRFTHKSGSTPPRARASASKAVPAGTVFSYKLHVEATVKIELKRLKAGRQVGKKCKPPSKANAKKKKCDLTEHALTRSGKAGLNKVPYTGKVKGKILAPGKYKAIFTATTAAGSGKPASVGFTFVKPKK